MKIAFITILGLLACAFTVHAPLITYVTVDNTSARCRFLFPPNFEQYSDTESMMYDASSSDITFEMNSRSTANIESLPGQNFQNQVNATSQSDKLQQFVNMLATATNGQVVNQFAITQDGQQGREIEINYVQEGNTWKSFVRFFWFNNTMYVFTVAGITSPAITNSPTGPTGQATDVGLLTTAKNQVFGSIDFY